MFRVEGKDRFWTSGFDVNSRQEYYWKSTGQEMHPRPSWWGEGEPNNSKDGQEQCIELLNDRILWGRGKDAFIMNDSQCNVEKNLICQEFISPKEILDNTEDFFRYKKGWGY